ncbi:MAG: hypothetical protein ACTSW1_12955 [Candidatus Hodarchaeales archaeon]
MGKWKRPEDQIESDLERKYWYYFFRVVIAVGLIGGLINTGVNIFAVLNGTAYESATHFLLYIPYSFIGGFALASVLVLWAIVIGMGVFEVLYFVWKIWKILSSLFKGQHLLVA